MKITHLKLRNYRGIEELDVNVPPAGVIAKGGNRRGKSTVLKAIKSALEANDIGADAIRLGEERGEILVDIDDLRVKRSFTSRGSTLDVERGGMTATKPTTFLKTLLGSSSIDPIELYTKKDKERRDLILAALPITVTRDDLLKYAPTIEDDFDVTGHGLVVLARAHKAFYDERTAANRDAEESARTAARLEKVAAEASKAVPAGVILPEEEAKAAVLAAERKLMEVETRTAEAEASRKRAESQTDQVATLRKRALDIEADLPEFVDTKSLFAELAAVDATLADLERQLEAARLLRNGIDDRIKRTHAANEERQILMARVAELRTQADGLDDALRAVTTPAPTAEELESAQTALDEARATLDRASKQAAALAAIKAAEAAALTAKGFAAEAADLDAIVKRLAHDAPNDLLAAANAISGLSLRGDEVLFEGKSLDDLSDAEKLKFCVDIARRANSRTKILVVDKLESIDEDQREDFVRYATAEGWQLFASLVTKGDLQLVAIEPDATAAAAE